MATVAFMEMLKPLTPRKIGSDRPEARVEADREKSELERIIAERARIARELEDARAEASELLADARAQAEAIEAAAWQEGYHDGETAARADVEAKLIATWNQDKELLRGQIQEMVSEIGRARQALWESQEGEMLDLCMEIARQVIKTEIEGNPNVLARIVRNAIRRVANKENVRVRVAVSDAEAVRGMRDELMSVIDGLNQLEIVEDRRIQPGGCVIDTNAGTIDAKIETQLAEIERALEINADA